ncbi:MAG: hypothetical protein M3309_07920 [Actinomycetota bacterium]|nr:hypothetical protein [Actinomycetota bacterium]
MSRRRRPSRRGPRSRRRGVGRGRGRRRIIITSVAPTGQVTSSSPTIRAIVEDRDGYLLSKHDIDVYLDGELKRFGYRRATGSLSCPTSNLSSGTHTVEIEATVETDDGVRTGGKKWTFVKK